MKRKFKTDLTRYGFVYAEAIERVMHGEFKMQVERVQAIIYHKRKMTKSEAAFVRGVLRGLSDADYGVE